MKYERLSIGIYRCIVGGHSPRFVYNAENYYTNYDLTIAHKEGLEVTIIEDGSPNALLYPSKSKTIRGSQLFGEYIDWIYGLRTQHPDCKLFKPLLSHIHGTLSEKMIRTTTYDADDNATFHINLQENEKMYSWVPKDAQLVVKTHLTDRFYHSDFARLQPFLMSKQRLIIYDRVLSKYWDDLISFNTDGGEFKQKIKEFENEPSLGAFVRK
jgi:hypothetical protein